MGTEVNQQLVLIGLLWFSTLACAQEWVAKLESPVQGSYRSPTETYRIYIPRSLPKEIRDSLRLELDAIDVTAMLEEQGSYVVFTPIQPLAWGQHTLRLVEYAEDGSILERAHWEFEVRRSAAFRERGFEVGTTLMGYKSVARDTEDDSSSDFAGEGTVAVAGTLADADWRLTGNADVVYNSNSELNFSDKSIGLGEFLFTGNAGSAEIFVGHHLIDYNSLILDNFRRRGIAGTADVRAVNSRVGGFVVRTNEIIGFEGGLGVHSSDNRTSGITLETQPLTNSPDALYLSAAYLAGTGMTDGSTISESNEQGDGHAWGAVVESSLLSAQLRLRGEYGATRFDFDAEGKLKPEDDHAYSLLASYASAPSSERSYSWNVGAEKRRVGTFFKSLANPALPADKDMIQLFGGMEWTNFSLWAFAAQETDNVYNSSSAATVRTRAYDLTLAYTRPSNNEGIARWLGDQYYALQLNHTRLDEDDRPIGVTSAVTDNEVNLVSMATDFSYDRGSWSLSYTYTSLDDNTGASSGQITQTIGANANIQFGDRVVVRASMQYDATEFSDVGVDLSDMLWSVSTSAAIIPNKLRGSLDLTLNQSRASDNSVEIDVLNIGGGMTWTLLPARRNSPGLEVILEGNYQYTADRVTRSFHGSDYQLFVSVKMALPLEY